MNMINLTEFEFIVLLEDFSRLDNDERAAIINSLQEYFDSDREAWHIACSPATAILMDFVTYMLDGTQE